VKAKELRDLSAEELIQRHAEALKESFDLRVTKVTGKLQNPLNLRLVRRDIARMKTIMRDKK
jgi:large subunit ribosomal protein L29